MAFKPRISTIIGTWTRSLAQKKLSRTGLVVWTVLIVCGVLLIVAHVTYFVWPFDLIPGRVTVLCSAKSKDGNLFEVSQY